MTMRIPVAVLVAAAVLAGPASAQQNPLDVVPEKMPFDVPYGAPITIDQAMAAAQAAADESKKRGWKLQIAVVGPGGQLKYFLGMDDAQLGSIAIAQHKARAAAVYRRETKIFENGIQNGLNYLITLDDVIASRGGIPLISGGKLIGAIGCSGGTGSQDEVACKAGAAVIK